MTSAVVPDQQQAVDPAAAFMPYQPNAPQRPKGDDPTRDDPNTATPTQNQQAAQLSIKAKSELMKLRTETKQLWSPNRRVLVNETLRAFEVLKGNFYTSSDAEAGQPYDPFQAAIDGGLPDDEIEDLYRYNNNIYQMLCLSFMAAMSPQVPKTRYSPEDADNQIDLATARRASTMMEIIERKNKIKALQKQELLHLWTGGCYFSYTRYVVDSDKWDYTNQPVINMVPQQVTPDRFICPDCGTATPADQFGAMQQVVCPDCGYQMGEEDYHEGQTIPVPQQVGEEQIPNGGVLMNVYGLMSVDTAPYANDLSETPLLDLEIETDLGTVRGAYEGAWKELGDAIGTSGSPDGDADRLARVQLASAGATRSGYISTKLITYSRCWIQPTAYNNIEDQTIVKELRQFFPKGVKLVTAGGIFLDAQPEKLTDRWTWCGTVEGMGLYPIPVGQACLDVQERINDVANTVHEHMERTAAPTILVDDDAVDAEAMSGKRMAPGTLTVIKRKGELKGKALSDVMFQPEFHIDSQIYNYGSSLVELAQLISGVQPQIFGGGTTQGVDTATGQQQMLNTALGRLGLFWDQIRQEHSNRAEVAVKCWAENMTSDIRNVIEGDTESGFENEFVLLDEVQGSFHAEPEADQGFPATFGEIRDRLMQLLQDVNNPFVQEFLNDPDNQKVVARYVAPPEIKIPGDEARSKYKRLVAELSKAQPMQLQPQEAMALGLQVDRPIFIPQTKDGITLPDKDVDNMEMIIDIAKRWALANWKQATTNPAGYANVKAYLRLAAQFQAEAQAKQLVTAAQMQAANKGPAQPPGQAQPQPAAAQ